VGARSSAGHLFVGWFEVGVGILAVVYLGDVMDKPKKIYIFPCARVGEGHPTPLVLGLATPPAIYENGVIDMGQNSAPVPSPTKKKGTQNSAQWISRVDLRWNSCGEGVYSYFPAGSTLIIQSNFEIVKP
jgi:hypothetical protein